MPNEIAKCPYCGETPYRSYRSPENVAHPVGDCALRTAICSLTDWNALCADIERGREAKTIRTALIGLAGDFAKSEALAGKAIELVQAMTIAQNSVVIMGKAQDFLDTPAVAAILKQQKDGGKG